MAEAKLRALSSPTFYLSATVLGFLVFFGFRGDSYLVAMTTSALIIVNIYRLPVPKSNFAIILLLLFATALVCFMQPVKSIINYSLVATCLLFLVKINSDKTNNNIISGVFLLLLAVSLSGSWYEQSGRLSNYSGDPNFTVFSAICGWILVSSSGKLNKFFELSLVAVLVIITLLTASRLAVACGIVYLISNKIKGRLFLFLSMVFIYFILTPLQLLILGVMDSWLGTVGYSDSGIISRLISLNDTSNYLRFKVLDGAFSEFRTLDLHSKLFGNSKSLENLEMLYGVAPHNWLSVSLLLYGAVYTFIFSICIVYIAIFIDKKFYPHFLMVGVAAGLLNITAILMGFSAISAAALLGYRKRKITE